ncbi:neuropilin and tolloid-like protein 1 isoform X2 [Ptychodera flava]
MKLLALLFIVSSSLLLGATTQHSRTQYHFTGSHLRNASGTFTSPDFPDRYPGGHHKFSYLIEDTDGGCVQLIFDDFILAENNWDFCQICLDGPNCTPGLHITYYGTNRPKAVISTGSMLYVDFGSNSYASDYTAVGFKATYQFVGSNTWHQKPKVAGSFHTEPSQQLFYSSLDWSHDINVDVVWSIQAPTNHQIWLRLNVSLSYELTTPAIVIRDGLTSEGALLYVVDGGLQSQTQYTIISNGNGMYIRLKTTMKGSHHNMYDYVWGLYVEYIDAVDVDYMCPRVYFQCLSKRICISDSLTCDGIDHCGDWSDEDQCDDSCNGCIHGNCECYDHGDSCECLCDEGYHGEHCDSKDSACPSCYNGGYCDTFSGLCLCPESFYGSQCEYYYSDDSSYYMILYICGGLIGLVLTCLCSLTLSRRRYNARQLPSTISAASGFSETDYANSFHSFNGDTELLADPNMFYNMEAPPDYSLCINTDNTLSTEVLHQRDSDQNNDGHEQAATGCVPTEPPPSYEDCTSGHALASENGFTVAAAAVDRNEDDELISEVDEDEDKDGNEINANESTA